MRYSNLYEAQAIISKYFESIKRPITVKQFETKLYNYFFDRPGIDKAGICKEYDMNKGYLNYMLLGKGKISKPYAAKIQKAMEDYGMRPSTRNLTEE